MSCYFEVNSRHCSILTTDISVHITGREEHFRPQLKMAISCLELQYSFLRFPYLTKYVMKFLQVSIQLRIFG